MAIFQFFSMAADAMLDFKNFKFLTVETVKRVEVHQCAKYRQSRCNRFRDTVFLFFFKLAAAAILDFWNFKFLTVGAVKRVELRHYAKFRWNRPKRGRDIVIYRFLKMAAAAILDFKNLKFLTIVTVKKVELHQCANFVKITVTAAEIWCFWIFQDGGRRHLGFSKFQIFNGGGSQDGRIFA